MDDVGVEQLAGLHLAKDDVPNLNLGGLLLDREFPPLRCYSLGGVERAGVLNWTSSKLNLIIFTTIFKISEWNKIIDNIQKAEMDYILYDKQKYNELYYLAIETVLLTQ